MSALLVGLAMTLLAGESAAASPEEDVMSVLQHWADDFNKGDTKAAEANCAERVSIVDDFPPHQWNGAGACTRWFVDFQAFAKGAEITEPIIAMGKPRHVDVTGAVAYVVVPVTLTYQKKRVPTKLDGIMTAILKGSSLGWRISAWTWADQ